MLRPADVPMLDFGFWKSEKSSKDAGIPLACEDDQVSSIQRSPFDILWRRQPIKIEPVVTEDILETVQEVIKLVKDNHRIVSDFLSTAMQMVVDALSQFRVGPRVKGVVW